MNCKLRTYKAFTLVELLVAIGLLAIVISFAGMIFRVSINAYRTAMANAEIMQKLRAITEQFDADFKGLCKDVPLLIWFQQDLNNPQQRYDQIMFFADGDFQSIQLYDYGKTPIAPSVPPVIGPLETVRGNTARIYYGQAFSRDSRDNIMRNPFDLPEKDRILVRNRHILTIHPDFVSWFANFNALETFYNTYPNNDFYEHDRLSLSEWKIADQAAYNQIIPACFGLRPQIDKYDPNTIHNLMSEGISSFSVQFGYWDTGPDLTKGTIDDYYGWYPSYDSDGNSDTTNDSHFLDMGPRNHMFGVSFNTLELPPGWSRIEDGNVEYRVGVVPFPPDFYPDALKFTFRLYDSKGIIKEGRPFTHIVYLY